MKTYRNLTICLMVAFSLVGCGLTETEDPQIFLEWQIQKSPKYTEAIPIHALSLVLSGDIENKVLVGEFVNCGQDIYDPPPDAILWTQCTLNGGGHNVLVYRAEDTLHVERLLLSKWSNELSAELPEEISNSLGQPRQEVISVDLPYRARVITLYGISEREE